MKFNMAKKVVFLIFLNFVSLQANEILSLKLQEQIDNNLINTLNEKFKNYRLKMNENRDTSLDNFSFSKLLNSKKLYIKTEKIDKIVVDRLIFDL